MSKAENPHKIPDEVRQLAAETLARLEEKSSPDYVATLYNDANQTEDPDDIVNPDTEDTQNTHEGYEELIEKDDED